VQRSELGEGINPPGYAPELIVALQ